MVFSPLHYETYSSYNSPLISDETGIIILQHVRLILWRISAKAESRLKGENTELEFCDSKCIINIVNKARSKNMSPNQNQKRAFSLNIITGVLISVAGIISVVFFFPFFGVSLDFAKMSLFSLLVIGATILWAIARLKEGALTVPRSLPAWAMAGIVISAILSAVLSPAVRSSFWGAGYETTTAAAIIVFAAAFFLAYLFIRTPKHVFSFYGWFIVVMLLIGVYEAIRLIGGPSLFSLFSLGMFDSILGNPIGKWNDMALLYGLSGMLSLLALSLFSFRGFARSVSIAVYGISIAALFIANFSLAWWLFAASAITIFCFRLMMVQSTPRQTAGEGNSARRFLHRIPLLPLLSVVIAVIFLIPGNNISDTIGARVGLSNIEVRPSWSATLDVTKTSIKENPLLGIGPNRFADAWLLYKPDGVNDTIFWDREFEQGIGIIPSFAVTGGMLGILLWLFFIGAFMRAGVRAAFISRADSATSSLLFGSFLSASYLFFAMMLYVPSVAAIILAFVSAGITLGMIAGGDPTHEKTYLFAKNPRIGFISVLVLMIILIFSVVGAYALAQRFIGALYLGSGSAALAAGDAGTAETKLTRAQALFPHDSTARVLTEAAILRMREGLADTSVGEETLRTRFQETLGRAVSAGKSAVAYDETNYQNWLALGRVYEAIVPLKIPGAYENAKTHYEKAAARNPHSPAIILALARLEAVRGDMKAAREYLSKAIEMKGDYTEAIFALAQLEAEAGNVKEAIAQTERASVIAPNDIGIFFQLGFLRYTAADYAGAVSALERTVLLTPIYANAKYFLGLSYVRIGRVNDAIQQFKDIETLNPDNVEVRSILENLRGGKDPFAQPTPVKEPPENRKKPPIEE